MTGSKKTLTDDLRKRGIMARQSGKEITECPFTVPHLKLGWMDGWRAGTSNEGTTE